MFVLVFIFIVLLAMPLKRVKFTPHMALLYTLCSCNLKVVKYYLCELRERFVIYHYVNKENIQLSDAMYKKIVIIMLEIKFNDIAFISLICTKCFSPL